MAEGEIRSCAAGKEVLYGGFCSRCGREHFLGSSGAVEPARRLMDRMEKTGRIDFQISGERADPRCSLEPLFGKARGQMFGVLICRDSRGQRHLLKAFSGQYGGLWEVPGWVSPLPDPRNFFELVAPRDARIKSLGTEILRLSGVPGREEEAEELRIRRRNLSRDLMGKIHGLYFPMDFRGEQRPLSDFFPGGIPAGTGDCCAPKLLHCAALLRLKPLWLAEFFWGRENLSGTRKHGEFYPSCGEKCGPLLGNMLCGSEEN